LVKSGYWGKKEKQWEREASAKIGLERKRRLSRQLEGWNVKAAGEQKESLDCGKKGTVANRLPKEVAASDRKCLWIQKGGGGGG